MWNLRVLLFSVFLIAVEGAAPVFSPTTYTATIGINTTAGTTLATVAYTFSDANEVVTLSADPTSDGYSYFGFSGLNLILANRLDVEYGLVVWSVRILAIDNGTTPETGTAILTLTTYDSTTTTTTTPAPPGYSWFDNRDNVILFGAFFAFIALLTAGCIVMCFRFHRIGSCLPRSCPEYRQCRASTRRQCSCCPLPCVFSSDHVRIEKQDDRYEYLETESNSTVSRRAADSDIMFPPNSPQALSEKEKSVSESVNSKGSKQKRASAPIKSATPVAIGNVDYCETDFGDICGRPVSPPIRSVTPITIGNVDYREAGFDGMRSPGFNAPMFTSYGGSSGASVKTVKTSNKKRKF